MPPKPHQVRDPEKLKSNLCNLRVMAKAIKGDLSVTSNEE
jgi:hypothetical protein